MLRRNWLAMTLIAGGALHGAGTHAAELSNAYMLGRWTTGRASWAPNVMA